MQGAINGSSINRAIVNGAGWESFNTATLFVAQADSVVTASAKAALGVVAPLLDAEDYLLGMTLTAVDVNGPNASANHTATSAVGIGVGAGSSTVMDGQGSALDSAVLVASALLGQQAAHQLLSEGKLNDLAAALVVAQAAHTLAATATVQLTARSTSGRISDAYEVDALVGVASMAQLLGADDRLSALVRRLLESRGNGSGIERHGPGNRLTPLQHGSNLTVH